MRESDVRFAVVDRAVARQGARFDTRDISEDEEVASAHRQFLNDVNYHAMIGKSLSGGRGRLRITELAKNHRGRGSLWQRSEADRTEIPPVGAASTVRAKPIREGHWQAVRAMGRHQFAQIVRLFDERTEIGGTYFRVIEKGFQPVDLHLGSPKPLIGVGSAFSANATAEQLERELDGRVLELQRKRQSLASSEEKQIEARFVRAALNGSLRLDPLPPTLRLIASQWRIDLGGRGRPVDLIAADVSTRSLVVVELKPRPDWSAIAQVGEYVSVIRSWGPESTEFFAALGHAMAILYGCPDMPGTLAPGRVLALAAWPGGDGDFEVVECP